MRDLVILFVHLIVTLARLAGPGGVRSVVAESVLVQHQLVILNRSRKRAPHLGVSDRIVAGLCALLMRPARIIRSAITVKPSTLLNLHVALKTRKYHLLFSPKRRRKPGPKAPSKELVEAVIEMKQRNPSWGCPRIAQQIAMAFDIFDQDGEQDSSSLHLSANSFLLWNDFLQEAFGIQGAGAVQFDSWLSRQGALSSLTSL
jgi:putative transposase